VALQGTIKDFALPDIFQLIGIQRKTGILTLENGEDAVTLKFLDGQVVGADNKTGTLEERLGELLVRTGRITQPQLEDALRLQQNTLQRLGHILVRTQRISEEDLVEALRVQSSQIIYRLFRWREGTYHFTKVEDLDYDQNHFIPISSETILMEGARMIDEWPLIERRIRSDRMVLRKTAKATAPESGIQSALDGNDGFDPGSERDRKPHAEGDPETSPADALAALSREEREVLSLVNGKRPVREICDLVTLGEFDTCRILSDLVTRQLVEEVQAVRDAALACELRPWYRRWATHAAHGGLAAVVMLGLATLGANPLTPWRLEAGSATTARLRLCASMARLERVENGLAVFYLDAGAFPGSLAALVHGGYVAPSDIVDPWNRPYDYEISPEGYRLSALDQDGQPSPELTVSRQFNAVQRMMGDTGGADR
jgi:hypothetical protein